MTREEAIKRLKEYAQYSYGIWHNDEEDTKAFDMAIEALQADAVQGYAEWLEKIIVDAETLEWLCEDTPCKEWCDENCHYKSIQAECLRHMYEVSKGGDSE